MHRPPARARAAGLPGGQARRAGLSRGFPPAVSGSQGFGSTLSAERGEMVPSSKARRTAEASSRRGKERPRGSPLGRVIRPTTRSSRGVAPWRNRWGSAALGGGLLPPAHARVRAVHRTLRATMAVRPRAGGRKGVGRRPRTAHSAAKEVVTPVAGSARALAGV